MARRENDTGSQESKSDGLASDKIGAKVSQPLRAMVLYEIGSLMRLVLENSTACTLSNAKLYPGIVEGFWSSMVFRFL